MYKKKNDFIGCRVTESDFASDSSFLRDELYFLRRNYDEGEDIEDWLGGPADCE